MIPNQTNQRKPKQNQRNHYTEPKKQKIKVLRSWVEGWRMAGWSWWCGVITPKGKIPIQPKEIQWFSSHTSKKHYTGPTKTNENQNKTKETIIPNPKNQRIKVLRSLGYDHSIPPGPTCHPPSFHPASQNLDSLVFGVRYNGFFGFVLVFFGFFCSV